MASKRKNTTIYEASTIMAVSLVRTSSLALAKMTLGSGGRSPPERPTAADVMPEAAQPRVGGRRHSVEPARHTATYLMDRSTDATTAATVDESATEYIRRVRERIWKEHYGPSSPPPPPSMPKYAAR